MYANIVQHWYKETVMAQAILITGASRGIGLEMAKQYSRDGWRVFACCRNPQTAEELGWLAGGSNGAISIHRLDVTDIKRIRDLAGELRDERIDVLFNNAGTGEPDEQSFGHTDESDWLEAFRINTIGPMKMVEAFVNHVSRSGRKIIATMSSIMGSIGYNNSGGYYIYRSSKAAVNMVMKTLSVDLEPRGIIAVCLHPGWVRTAIGGPHAPLSPEESVKGLRTVLSSLTHADNGRFLTYEGKELPW
jgi:NAD(P)-dependent dehydrogenase (short-subunit alcohol dehydrogenase family)